MDGKIHDIEPGLQLPRNFAGIAIFRWKCCLTITSSDLRRGLRHAPFSQRQPQASLYRQEMKQGLHAGQPGCARKPAAAERPMARLSPATTAGRDVWATCVSWENHGIERCAEAFRRSRAASSDQPSSRSRLEKVARAGRRHGRAGTGIRRQVAPTRRGPGSSP